MANRRFEMHEIRQVLVRMRLGDSDRTIAQTGLMGRKKAAVIRQLAQAHGWLDASKPLPEDGVLAQVLQAPGTRRQMSSQVLPHQEDVLAWWKQGIVGTTIHQALVRKYDFAGSYSSVRRFLQQLEAHHPEVTTVLDFAPGEVAQVDFGKGPTITDVYTGEVLSTWIFAMVLAWSRHLYAELVCDQKVATWLGCHRRAFEFFGGVPEKVIIDNPKCAITRACYHDPQVQRAYGECAEGYGFLIAPCPPRDPKKKGRIESGVKYVKNGFVPLREFRHIAQANQQLKTWLLGPAGNRLHGTTQEKPLTRFVETERFLLHSLPDCPPELATWTQVKVHGDCHVQFEKCRYSVPFRLVRQRLWLRASETTVRCYQEQHLVAVHPRLSKPGARATLNEHLPPEALAYKMQDPTWCRKQAQAIGPQCLQLIETLFAHRVLDNLRAAQGVIGLGKRYGPCRLEAACQRALAFDNPRYRTVKTILEKGLDQQPLDEPPPAPLASAYTGQGRFARDTPQLFTPQPGEAPCNRSLN
jgi:transposase